MNTRIFLNVIFLLFMINYGVYAGNYYVSVEGSDSHNGSIKKPFRSISMAASIMKAGDTCFIREGVYYETVAPVSTGLPGKPIVFMAYHGEKITISGAEPVKDWKDQGDNVYTAKVKLTLGTGNQVFYKKKMMDEARWPNNRDGKIMTPDTYPMKDGGSNWFTTDANISFNGEEFTGAKVWMMSGMKWVGTASRVIDYEKDKGKIIFKELTDGVRKYMTPVVEPGSFYLEGKKAFLDYPNEWIYDEELNELSIVLQDDEKPDKNSVWAKVRKYGLIIENTEYIEFKDLNFFGCTVKIQQSNHCRLQGLHFEYISHESLEEGSYRIPKETGLIIRGSNNIIQNCELSYSAGKGILIDGDENRLINSYIHHTAYLGAESPVTGFGRKCLISHNTIAYTGRHGFDFYGPESIIQYNEISHAGLISFDLGLFHEGFFDGGGMEVHHNWFHDCYGETIGHGYYHDNFNANVLFHHNVIWNVDGDGLRLNIPSQYINVFNNTILGNVGYWGRWPTDDMTGVRIMNNIITGNIQYHPDMVLENNYFRFNLADTINQDFSLIKNSSGIDEAIIIPGINDTYAGEKPDMGAYEYGLEYWKPGHDFSKVISPEYSLTPHPYRNLVVNGSFEFSAENNDIPGWFSFEPEGIIRSHTNATLTTRPELRPTRIGKYGLLLEPGIQDSVFQSIEIPQPGKYTFFAWAFAPGDDTAVINVTSGGQNISKTLSHEEWRRISIDFEISENAPEVKIVLSMRGMGKVHFDDVAIIPYIPSYEPPTPPTHFHASKLSSSSLALHWKAPEKSLKGIKGYEIFRNDKKIAEMNSSVHLYEDANLRGQTIYNYAIEAVDRRWNHSDKSVISVQTLQDTIKPKIARVHSLSDSVLQIVFSEPISWNENINLANQLNFSDSRHFIRDYYIHQDENRVTVSLNKVLEHGRKYLISVKDIADKARISNVTKNQEFSFVHNPYLVGYWDFNEGSGTVLHDLSQNKNHGKITAEKWIKGVSGSALRFNGDSYIEVGNDESLNVSGDFSLSVWIKLDDLDKGLYSRIIGKKDYWIDPHGYELECSPPLERFVIGGANQSSNTQGTFRVMVEDTSWHNITAVINDRKGFFYIDGELVAEDHDVTPPLPNDELLFIGSTPAKSSKFHGSMDELYIYRKALDQQEIKNLIRKVNFSIE